MWTIRPAIPQLDPAPAPYVDRGQSTRDRVKAGGEHDHIERELCPLGAQTRWLERDNRVCPYVDQRHVRQVEGRVIVRVKTDALGRYRISMRSKFARRLWILHGLRDLTTHEMGGKIVRREVPSEVVERQDETRATGSPELLKRLLALLHRHLERRLGRQVPEVADWRRPSALPKLLIVTLHAPLCRWVGRRIASRNTKARGALEDK